MTFVRTKIYPLILASALFTLGGCGLIIEEGPTDATLATMDALQAITEAIGNAVLPADVTDTTLPFAVTASAASEEGDLAAYGRSLVQALGGTSQPLLVTITFPDPDPTVPPPGCAISGTVPLVGASDLDDGRDTTTGLGQIRVYFSGMDARPDNCVGYGHRSTGQLTANANDKITVTATAIPNVEHWLVDRHESANGALLVVKESSGTAYSVNVSWQRIGTLDLDVDNRNGAPYVTLKDQSQTVYTTVNGQSCTGSYTGRLFNPYEWNCSGG